MEHPLPQWREREHRLRRRAILNAARRVFAERSFEHATLKEIAERAEFGKGTLYNYFPGGKQELAQAVLDDAYDELYAHMEAIADRPPPASHAEFRQALRDGLYQLTSYLIEHRRLFLLLSRATQRMRSTPKPAFHAYLNEHLERLLAPLVDFFHAWDEATGALRHTDPRLLAYTLLTSLHGYVVCLNDPTREAPPDAASKVANDLTALFVDGLHPENDRDASRPRSTA